MKKKKILFLGNSNLVIFGFRGEIIQKFIDEGYEVYTVFPNGPFGEGEKSAEKYNCKFIKVDMNRRGKSPFQDIILLKKYIELIKKIKPDVVLAYTAKCDIYGGIACRILRVPFMPNITGLGKGLIEGKITTLITKTLYKIAIKNAECIFFQNNSDKKFFEDNKIQFKRSIVLPGSGVNLDKFVPLEYPSETEKIKFIYIARIMKAKGIEEFLEAAHLIKKDYPETEFHICGYCEENYKEIIEEKEEMQEIIYHGLVEDVIEYEKMCHCIVLPSFHPEGISNTLLEAAASARPIITTNRTGCKETVEDNVTGYLIKERNSGDLRDKIEKFIKLSHEQKIKMGLEGRKLIEKKFDRKIVVQAYDEQVKNL